MQTVSSQFTAEAESMTRKVAGGLLVSWKKDYLSTIRGFTIGVSSIGGSDYIASDGGVDSDWNKYRYFDESQYLTSVSYEQELSQPIGGLAKKIADVSLDNTTGRFTPRYAGGTSELFTSVYLPRRPMIINSGFEYNGIDNLIPQFVGITSKAPKIDKRSAKVDMQAFDFIDYLSNTYIDQEAMFTGYRTDQILEQVLITSGYSTSQYDLDVGLNIVPFAEFKTGDKFGPLIDKLVEAENGHFYQDEQGILRFENRQHYINAPYTQVQRVITTAQVIEARTPTTDHIINVVEVKSKPREKQPNQLVFTLSGTKELPVGDTEIFVNFDDPMLEIDNPVYVANTQTDGEGTDVTSSISLKSYSKFARAAKIVLSNNSGAVAFITNMTLYGRPAKVSKDLYTRLQDDSSVTAYEERPFVIENEYIGNESWANTYGQMILGDYSEPENIQELVIRALPELQLGDLISWQGRYWRIYGIKTSMEASSGFLQTLKIVQRDIISYFQIGVSSIGGNDQIAP